MGSATRQRNRQIKIANMNRGTATVFALTLMFSAGVLAHWGGLNQEGCHNNRKTGEYHCHRKSAPKTDTSAYDRDDYLPRWADADRDCRDTRQEVLADESLVPVTWSRNGCSVTTGRWHDPYTGRVFTDPSDLDIDHLVPLKEAHDSGAAAWSQSRKRAYANDLSHPEALIAVYNGANRAKGADDPASWLPPETAYHCHYVFNWKQVKGYWGLEMDAAEERVVNSILENCESKLR